MAEYGYRWVIVAAGAVMGCIALGAMFSATSAIFAMRGHHRYIVPMRTYQTTGRRTMFATNLLRLVFGGMVWLTVFEAKVSAGEIYKSIDANGNVVYSDHPDASGSQSTVVQLDDPVPPQRDAGNSANPDSSSSSSSSSIVSSAETPPPLPAEDQPTLPEDGYLWTPGYWYWRDQAYLWIPGAWVRPPRAGVLWTPAWWGRAGSLFVFHPGYWGSTVGFYGGVNYGFGYFGSGYSGGHWLGHSFAYNSAVNHVNPAVAHHAYAQSVTTASLPNQGPRPVVKTATIQRTTVQAPRPTEVARPAAVVKTPPPSVPAKSSHVTATRVAAPVKQ